jgi:hypothetical protein
MRMLCETAHIYPIFFPRTVRERVFGERVGTGSGRAAAKGENQTMIQQTRQWRSGKGERAWLSALVETMEQVSRPELRAKPCDAGLLAAVQAHLAGPSVPRGLYGSNFSLRN